MGLGFLQEGIALAADLHCHTKISDGSVGIEELITIAKRRGLTTIAVTDHDTVAGATRAVNIGKRQNVKVIHGVEFTTWDYKRNKQAHLLCYLCDHPDRLEGLCRRTLTSRQAAGVEMVRRVMRYYPITPEMVTRCATGSMCIYKQHIMHALMDAGYADSIFGDVFHKLFANDTGVARVDVTYPDTREVLEAIHEAGGIAVLAHPPVYHSEELLEELIELGLDGIEVWHPYHSPEQTAQLLQLAEQHGLVTTGGSDFHGMYARTSRPLGSTSAPDEAIAQLLDYKEKKSKAEKAAAKG